MSSPSWLSGNLAGSSQRRCGVLGGDIRMCVAVWVGMGMDSYINIYFKFFFLCSSMDACLCLVFILVCAYSPGVTAWSWPQLGGLGTLSEGERWSTLAWAGIRGHGRTDVYSGAVYHHSNQTFAWGQILEGPCWSQTVTALGGPQMSFLCGAQEITNMHTRFHCASSWVGKPG